ncbi:MAG: STAS domain-containing protein [Gammaproteobacteria bacterium]|nr:STAS domain-containing protein [Gammaproteobacteria bacterium]MDE0252483.1 STAS domain-containing protein [Gammaproteobacteria bacterium]MDE0403518.1 STAS domain-containing protein [Gammaproteobacteria bacterium]
MEHNRNNGVLTSSVSGRIDGMTATEFEENVRGEVAETDTGVIIDLSGVTYLSSAGLRSMLLIAKMLNKLGSAFVLCSVPNTILEIIKIAGFDRIINVVETHADAIAKVGKK